MNAVLTWVLANQGLLLVALIGCGIIIYAKYFRKPDATPITESYNKPTIEYTDDNKWAVIKMEDCKLMDVLPLYSELRDNGWVYHSEMNEQYLNDPFIIFRKKE